MNNRPILTALEQGASHVTTHTKSGNNLKSGNNQEKTMQEFYNEITKDVLARTIWGEARGEGAKGMQAIANVILNRVAIADKRGSFWWGDDIIQVCQKPYQFSCWNRSDPNFQKLQQVNETDHDFATAKYIAQKGIEGKLKDITHGATHYHTKTTKPYWAKSKTSCKVIGNHVLYALVD